eukprot:COSAG06_NODE_1043_length_10979_cov_54.806250_10_plen_64_part_00
MIGFSRGPRRGHHNAIPGSGVLHTHLRTTLAPGRRATARRVRNLRALARGPGAGIDLPDRIFL